ncbi:Crp/Fnr family transcriptional regulator [Ideonella sp. DXS29W]|uniref:Crp/Fnr family transcriptional regulator n=1 Tax=Ideonella lacteola TaxID=2984193 RepID=A0ABU9BNE8_9BURK
MGTDTATVTLERPDAPSPRHSSSRTAAFDATSGSAVADALQRAFHPSELDPADASLLAQIAIRHAFAAHAPVLQHGSPNSSLWLVARGRVSVGMHDAQGHWRQTRGANAGEWLDVASAWLGGALFEEAVAATDAVVYELPLEEVQALCNERPRVAQLLIEALALRIRQTTDTARELAVKDVPSRLAGWLLDHLSPAQPGPARVKLDQHKRLLASELGTSPETFSRALARLRALGCIAVKGYSVDVLDVEALSRLAGRASLAHRPGA